MIDYENHSWLRIVLTVRGTVGPRLMVRVAIAIGLGILALWAYRNAGVAVPPLAHTLIGVALGLLLVFRTNASYARYVEARVLLGRINDASRDLARQVAAYVPVGPHIAGVHRDLARWIDALYGLLVQNLRDEDRLDALSDRLEAHEIAQLRSTKTRPLVVGTWISARLAELHAEGRVHIEILRAMDANLTAIVQAVGGCQRIRGTPVPFAYAQHIKVFLVLFCYTVPFVMVETLGLYTPVASAVLAFALFGIDEIGVEIEDPFGTDPNDLPMDRIGATIATSVGELLAAGSGVVTNAPESTAAAE
jgi:ion channel-forming bestrophin family protein